MLNIISLGAGVQSSTVEFQADVGLITPMPVASIMADTHQEPKSVYRWLEYLRANVKNIPITVVSRGDLGADGLIMKVSGKSGKTYQKNLIPLFIKNPDGSRGILGRKCTAEYKVREIQKATRAIVGLPAMSAWRRQYKPELRLWAEYLSAMKLARKERRKPPVMPDDTRRGWTKMQSDALVCTWIGISTDEASRMKPSSIPWIVNRWPLIELGMSRQDCKIWMTENGHPEPPRSACVFCPYHSDEEWQRLQREEPEDFAEAVQWEIKAQIANASAQAARGEIFLHSSLVPIGEIDFASIPPKPQQFDMFDNECEGMCGV